MISRKVAVRKLAQDRAVCECGKSLRQTVQFPFMCSLPDVSVRLSIGNALDPTDFGGIALALWFRCGYATGQGPGRQAYQAVEANTSDKTITVLRLLTSSLFLTTYDDCEDSMWDLQVGVISHFPSFYLHPSSPVPAVPLFPLA